MKVWCSAGCKHDASLEDWLLAATRVATKANFLESKATVARVEAFSIQINSFARLELDSFIEAHLELLE